MRIILFAAIFMGIVGLIGFSVHSGIIQINKPENLFGEVGLLSSDGFKFVGKIDLNNEGAQNFNIKKDITESFSEKTIQKKKQSRKSQKSNSENYAAVVAKIAATAIATSSSATTVAETAEIISAATTTLNVLSESTSSGAFATSTIMKNLTEEESIAVSTSSSTSNVSSVVHIAISEILVGVDGGANYEFVELYNPNSFVVDLTGWSIKKRSSGGSESTFVSANRFENKKIMPNKYLLLANEGGYNGSIQPDIFWPKSYTLAYVNNAIILYNPDGKAIEDVGWDEIGKGQSLERVVWSGGEFKAQNNPNPQNSSY